MVKYIVSFKTTKTILCEKYYSFLLQTSMYILDLQQIGLLRYLESRIQNM